MDWWLIVHTPTGVRCWPIGDPDPVEREALINAGRVLAGVAADELWAGDDEDSGWVVSLSPGEPHPTLLAQAAVGTLDDLGKADPAAVAAHVAGRAQWHAARQIKIARERLAALDNAELATALAALADADLAAVLADPAVADRLAAVPVVVPAEPEVPVVGPAIGGVNP